ncbi:NTP transferase domain-containing protein [Christensenella sp. MSJ-20]|uniref:sugar phosphate nucleotidyltransferase n=1 Tax=Christensenella sp. MSJ-20 TaxID=2841518 RepID=UPI001C764D9A|nr:NTP transferase domain-containing protein [Christensenella sp. MSJ-20]
MSLTKTQFDILAYLERNTESVTQRQLANATGRSLGTINKTVLNLSQLGYLQDGTITPKGLEALEPYRVKRAVFIAAGFGTRLVPITLNTPKPLVRVNGTRIIDTLLDAIVAAGIEEIVIVRGYLAEQFDQLLYKYPNIRFIENPIYNEANNISSAICAKDLLGGAYVLEADLLLYNPALIQKYQYCSNYLGVPVEVTDDWCLYSKNGIITKLVVGGRNCHHLFGISYWTEQDGTRLAGHLQQVYDMPGGKERYWDQAALEYFIHDYRVAIRECTFEDIIEIDTFRELVRLDSTYDIG